MADICMCSGTGCDKKDQCYRHTAPRNDMWQSMFVDPPIKDGECEMFWDNKEYESKV